MDEKWTKEAIVWYSRECDNVKGWPGEIRKVCGMVEICAKQRRRVRLLAVDGERL